MSFDSKSDAKREIRTMQLQKRFRSKKANKALDKTLRAYECNICGDWHLTSLHRNITRRW